MVIPGHEIAAKIGNFAGCFVMPGSLEVKALKPVLKGVSNPLIRTMTEGAMVNGSIGFVEDIAKDKPATEVFKNISVNLGTGAVLDLGFHGLGKGVEYLATKPNEIGFSQSSVNGAEEITQSMKMNGWEGEPIDVVCMGDGKLTAIDNIRVVAAREAGIEMKVTIHDADEVLSDSFIKRFTTDKGIQEIWEDTINLRIGKQKASFRKQHPSGFDNMERIGK